MHQALLLIFLIIFALYLWLILYYKKSWHQIPGYPVKRSTHQTTISVIIPARNEAAAITACLTAVCNQNYPASLFEVLVVDDHSTDNTAEIIQSFRDKNVKLITLQHHVQEKLNSYKKKAVETAVSQATGELIVTTDADCIAPPNWLSTLASFYEEYQPVFIAAPVRIAVAARTKKLPAATRFLQLFQQLDFMTLQGITGASVYKKMHRMCNGANMAYTKKAFEAVGGFSGIDHIASGDDMLLMHKIYKQWPDKVLFLKSQEAIVQTEPVNSLKEFFNQRIRWASKAPQYPDTGIFAVLLLVYLLNVAFLLFPFTALFISDTIPVFGFSFSVAEWWFLMLALKTVVELLFLYPVAGFFGCRQQLWFFPLMQPFHIVYTVIAGWLGKFGTYRWKERKVK